MDDRDAPNEQTDDVGDEPRDERTVTPGHGEGTSNVAVAREAPDPHGSDGTDDENDRSEAIHDAEPATVHEAVHDLEPVSGDRSVGDEDADVAADEHPDDAVLLRSEVPSFEASPSVPSTSDVAGIDAEPRNIDVDVDVDVDSDADADSDSDSDADSTVLLSKGSASGSETAAGAGAGAETVVTSGSGSDIVFGGFESAAVDAEPDVDADADSTVLLSKGPAFEPGPVVATSTGPTTDIAFGGAEPADTGADATPLLSKGPAFESGPAAVNSGPADAGADAGADSTVILSKGPSFEPGPAGGTEAAPSIESSASTDGEPDEPIGSTVSLSKLADGPARAGTSASVTDTALGASPPLGDGLIAGPAAAPAPETGDGTARGGRRVLVLAALGVVVFLVAAVGTGALWSALSGGTSGGPAAADPASTSSGAPGLDTSYFDGLVEQGDVDGTAESGGGNAKQPSRELVYESLMSAKTPKLCEHAPSSFHDGLVGDSPFETYTGQTDGGAWLKWIEPSADSRDHYAAFVDVTGDGIEDVAVAVGCYMGGTAMWPDNVVFYEVDESGGVTLLDGTSIGEISSTGRANFQSFTVTDAGVEVAWLASITAADEPIPWTADLTWTASGLTVSNASPH
ncbi:hypothetical protein F8O01_05220 [Pseudoclavibacter chungangensis]|uniref:Uncharacterized protein n=1 Tax=Pseudoclavibacter chungangensis TaxID=587635 RepID=A0A7J5BZC0_9MICO|nr:hypothetical protein [Pseudoclavibacter chungangensis]KAB1659659.1 hypothetical protein F8O01_05220 [Pseudoclavibacter chungangensis]NYJ67497.1 hypothetical protein [Pseudoclavibacter chungangensis]